MATILVTGGAGYIGSHTLIELLENSRHTVISVDNFSNSAESAYDRVAGICERPFTRVDVDLCDRAAMVKALDACGKIDAIIHFAAFKSVPDSMKDPVRYYDNNLGSLQNMLYYAGARGINHFIFSSSCSVYGNASALPVTETTTLLAAESAYGHTKQVGEEIIRFFTKAHPEFNAVMLRYFNPVGAHMSGQHGEMPITRPNNLVPIITQTAVGKNALTVFGNDYPTRDGSCIRDYIHVTDIADAHIKAVDFLLAGKAEEAVNIYNLGTGNGVSVLEAIHSFEKVAATKLPYVMGARRSGDVIAVYADNSKAKSELGWHPRYNLDDMMLSAWRWQQELERTGQSVSFL